MNTPTLPHDLTDEQLACALIRHTGLGLMDAARLILELQNGSASPREALTMEYCMNVIQRGCRDYGRQPEEENSFGRAIGLFLEHKRHRRPNTQLELRHYTRRFLRCKPCWAQRSLRSITKPECRRMLEEGFPNPSSRRKARIILHGLFSFCHKSGWLAENPADFVDEQPPVERRITPLSLNEAARLLHTCRQAEHRECAAAVGIMLWAGVRPAEVERLRWEDVKLREGTIILHPQHTKTGGARCVSIEPVLAWWLERVKGEGGSLCPRNWKRKWASLHHAAGLAPWVPDVLRHSFASYHAARYRNFEQLQYEMGHRSLQLLRYRYLATGGISPGAAADFWNPTYWRRELVARKGFALMNNE